ncbi:MAG: galactose oxidase [Pedosphaera sp.]|nr:galactose oxidase [Pedosphaera sp.]
MKTSKKTLQLHSKIALLGVFLISITRLLAAELLWEKLEPIPNSIGVAGSFAGIDGSVLIVAGGANFPAKKPWEGGTKVWHKSVSILPNPEERWRSVGTLVSPLGYGVALSHPRGLLCIGGSSATEHHRDVFILHWTGSRLETEIVPSLPERRAGMAGVLIGNKAYIFGGTDTPNATSAKATLFAIDLAGKKTEWRKLEQLPAAGRILSTAGTYEGSLYIFGGVALQKNDDGKPVRQWLRDAWRYTPGRGWGRLIDLPRPAVAAPAPAPLIGEKLLLLGSDDGSKELRLPSEHPGFSKAILAYDPIKDVWEEDGNVPQTQVTTSAVVWGNRWVIPSGEIRPGIRSPEVWSALLR